MGPHFLCIGAPRCGTTWLYDELSRHPQIQRLPGKELMFLGDRRRPQEKARRVKGWAWRWRHKYKDAPGELEWGLRWLERYSKLGESLNVYLSLFHLPEGKLAGDISPTLCRIADSEVRNIRAQLGDIRVFMLARDPIERDWSHAQLILQHHKTAEQQSDAAYIEFIGSERCQILSNYLRMMDLWGGIFSAFRVFYLDDITVRPNELMREVCEFLDIDPDPPGFKVSEIAPNPTAEEIGKFVRSPQIYEAQKRISEPLMTALNARLEGHPAAWYARHYGQAPVGSGPFNAFYRNGSAAVADHPQYLASERGKA